MSRLTDGLPGSGGIARVVTRDRTPDPQAQYLRRREGKELAQRARCDSGVTYERIAAATGRSMQLVWDAMNLGNDRRQLTYADLIAMSRHSHTKTFVAHLLEPIEQAMRGTPGQAQAAAVQQQTGERKP